MARPALPRSRVALLMVLGATLFMVSCASWLERGAEPAGEEGVSVPLPVSPPAKAEPADPLRERRLSLPVAGMLREPLRDSFVDKRGGRLHQAIDIMAPRGTAVVAVDEGRIAKVYRHPLGGLSVYQYDAGQRHAYYYAHLEAFAPGLKAGVLVKRGDPIGKVGTTGNASPGAPHLHFAIYRLGPEQVWWRGTPLNPYDHLAPPP